MAARKALGKGLGALIPDIETEPEKNKDYFYCDTHLIRPNPFQPRRRFTDEDLAELSESIKTRAFSNRCWCARMRPVMN